MKIAREHFEEWLANPVTEAVLKTCIQNAEDNKALWFNTSWIGGKADQIELVTLRSRAAAALELSEFEFGDLLDELKIEEKNDGIKEDLEG